MNYNLYYKLYQIYFQSLKECRDLGEQLTAADLRGRTLLWKMTRGLTPKSDTKAFEGICLF